MGVRQARLTKSYLTRTGLTIGASPGLGETLEDADSAEGPPTLRELRCANSWEFIAGVAMLHDLATPWYNDTVSDRYG